MAGPTISSPTDKPVFPSTITPIQLPAPKRPGKRQTVAPVGHGSTVENVKRPTNDSSGDRICPGHGSEPTPKGDNGFYTRGFILKTPLDFFIDNGSTCSLLSLRKYNELKTDLDPLVRPIDTSVYGACGNVIPSHGTVDVKISLDGCDFEQTLIICDIQQDAVIGQDFLLNYEESINYKQARINMKFNEIICWLGERSTVKCRVMVRNTTAVLSQTASWLPIQVPSLENLTKVGFVQANVASNTISVINSSILDLQKAKKRKSVVNNVENLITPLSKQAIGMCEVYPDKNDDTGFYQSRMYSTVQWERPRIKLRILFAIFQLIGRAVHFLMSLMRWLQCQPQTRTNVKRFSLELLINR